MAFPLRPEAAGIVVAVREELRAVCARMSALSSDTGPGSPCYTGVLGCIPVIVASSGMGADRAERTASDLIARCAPTTLVIAGFAAGLVADVAPGDVVVATSVVSVCDGRRLAPDEHLLAATRRANPIGSVRFGPLVTSDTISLTPDDKRSLASRFPDAVAVDMETAGAACAAVTAGIPWIAIRAITDGLADSFPLPFDRYVDPDGEPDRSRIVLAALTHPRSIPGLVRLGRRSTRAAGNLAVLVEATVRAMRGETR
jgi:adenosylhomocysteine nucleosidase